MNDQATLLRKKVKKVDTPKAETKTKIITIASGKGGVGKSNITLNIGLALQQVGKKVLLLDADLGMANLDILLGITPMYNLNHILQGKCSFVQALQRGPSGLDILAGTSAGEDLINISPEEIDRLMTASAQIESNYDIIIIDVGAGVNISIINFILACDEAIIVLTPEPTAIMDAYSLIKYLSNYRFKREIGILVNRVSSIQEGKEVAHRMQTVIKDFLEVDIEIKGFIPEDSYVREAVKKQSALLSLYPKSKAGQALKEIASKLIKEETASKTSGMDNFMKRVLTFFNRDKGSD